MKTPLILISLFGLSGQGFSSSVISIRCFEEINQYGVHATIDVKYSEAPFLRDITTVTLDEPGEPVETIHLSTTKVCSLDKEFANACRLTVRNSEFDYYSTFSCQDGVKGEIILEGSTLSFSCQGPGVPMQYRDGVNFRNCELNR